VKERIRGEREGDSTDNFIEQKLNPLPSILFPEFS
jgi:hypothetical protein